MMMSGHNHSNFSENMQRCHDYIKALEEERRKIQVFQRELPLCLELVTKAIETCKQQLSGTTTIEYHLHDQSECSEQTSSDLPVFEEFIPIRRASSDSDGEEHESKKVFEEFIPIRRASSDSDGEEHESKKSKNDTSDCNGQGRNSSDKNCKKSDWLRSVQLWNQTPDPPSKEEVKGNGGGGAFHPFKKERGAASDGTPASTSSTAENGGGNKKEQKEGQSQRKARRCWSPELHRRFLQALQQLGGSHVATPKQIRELMKVDGLTSDEVKSHLQKYRLHSRRPSPSSQNNNAQTPQFVVVGGLWVPPEYASLATNTKSAEAAGGAASKGIYAPIAAPPPPFQEPSPSPKQRQHIKPSSQPNDRGGRSYGKGRAQSCSPATSSSTHTTTAVSPAC